MIFSFLILSNSAWTDLISSSLSFFFFSYFSGFLAKRLIANSNSAFTSAIFSNLSYVTSSITFSIWACISFWILARAYSQLSQMSLTCFSTSCCYTSKLSSSSYKNSSCKGFNYLTLHYWSAISIFSSLFKRSKLKLSSMSLLP